MKHHRPSRLGRLALLTISLLLAVADALLGTNLVWGVGIVQAVLGSLTAVVIGKATLRATPRCVNEIPSSALAASAAVTPGMTS